MVWLREVWGGWMVLGRFEWVFSVACFGDERLAGTLAPPHTPYPIPHTLHHSSFIHPGGEWLEVRGCFSGFFKAVWGS